MKGSFGELLDLKSLDRRQIYSEATAHWPTTAQFIEKDLWVCAVLDALFNDIAPESRDLVFKGGTSLSKVHQLTHRFSEDIDLVIVREQLGFAGDKDPMNPDAVLSGKARERLTDDLKAASAEHVGKVLLPALTDLLAPHGARVRIDEDPGQGGQTLLIAYDSAIDRAPGYVEPVVKIEGGARSATLPAHVGSLTPYLAVLMDDRDFKVDNVRTIDAERTFLDKLLILHSRQCYYRDRGQVYREANRESRHYYDVAMMAGDPLTDRALADPALRADVIRHSRLAFPSSWARFDEAEAGNLCLVPEGGLRQAIKRDYAQMAEMIMGDAPNFEWVMESVASVAKRL